MTDEDVVKLCMWLTGHTEETIKQLISNWEKYHKQ